MRPQSRNEFQTAIICALPLEFDAVEASFDDVYDEAGVDVYGKQPGDPNWYRTGRIGSHNVVLTCLPRMGKTSAASVASNLQISFPRVNLGLLVGICGAVPFPSEHTEVILGDVIISDRVVEYDFGKQYPDGFRQSRAVKETLGGANRSIRSFLSGLKTRRMHDQLQDDLWKYQQNLQSDTGGKWQYPGISQDLLFEAFYRHKHYHQHPDTTCLCADCHCSSDPICDRALEIDCRKLGCMGSLKARNRLTADCPKPQVHFGSMASADTVMKSGEHRDKLAETEKVIGFEMEGAGIWDSLPCVIIKGVCDYADSHKNKTWQDYAAATAASCAKAFLKYWAFSVSDRQDPPPVTYGADRADSYEETLPDNQRKELLDLLRFDQIDARQMSLKAAQGKTCRWMLQNHQYRNWLDSRRLQSRNGFLWIKGKPGAGKSIMMKFLFREARKRMKNTVVISFFFNARGDALEKSTMGLYRSLLLHLLERIPDLMPCLDYCGRRLDAIKTTGWQLEMLKEVFTLAVERLQDRRVLLYVDALDECPEDDIRDMISLFEDLCAREKSGELLICFSSRHYPEITIKTGLQLVLEKEQDHEDDIRLYIDSQLKIDDTSQVQADDIKAEILRKSSGIFLWAALVIPILNKEHDRGRIKALKRRLDEIPTGLHDLFLDIITRDCNDVEAMVLCIQFILFAKRPLSPEELQVALSTGLDDSPPEEFNAEEINLRRFILNVSKGLAEITKSRTPTVQFIHESVRDFLLKEGGLNMLPARAKNIEAQSHVTFTRVCLLQLRADLRCIKDYLTLATHGRKFPFLEYAINHVIHHANAAQHLGISQVSLFEHLNLDIWIRLYNALQRHSKHIFVDRPHLLYILSAQGADALIRIHPERSSHLSLKGGQFEYPLLAALYSGSNSAARALLGIYHSRGTHPDESNDDHFDTPGKMKVQEALKSSRNLLSYLSEFGDTVLLRKMLETRDYKDNQYDKMHLRVQNTSPLYYASSEAVVGLLMEFAKDIGLFVGLDKNEAVSGTNIAMGDDLSNTIPLPQIIEFWPNLLGQTFLEFAAERGFEELARIAIQHASQTVNQTNSKGQTPFSIAAQGRINHTGRLAVIRDLHKVHANPNMPDKYGQTPLHYAVLNPFNEDIIRLLSSISEVDLEHKNDKGLTALASAVLKRRKGYVQILLAGGADPMSRLPDGSTLLIYSVKMDYIGIYGLLFEDSRCEHDASDLDGRTALSWCATVHHHEAEMMRMLLSSDRVDPNLRDNDGRTALEWAIRCGCISTVKLLCSSCLSLDIKDGRGRNILELVADLCSGTPGQFDDMAGHILASGHVKPHWKKWIHDSLLERCESSGLAGMSHLIRTFLAGGDLSGLVSEYNSLLFSGKIGNFPAMNMVEHRY